MENSNNESDGLFVVTFAVDIDLCWKQCVNRRVSLRFKVWRVIHIRLLDYPTKSLNPLIFLYICGLKYCGNSKERIKKDGLGSPRCLMNTLSQSASIFIGARWVRVQQPYITLHPAYIPFAAPAQFIWSSELWIWITPARNNTQSMHINSGNKIFCFIAFHIISSHSTDFNSKRYAAAYSVRLLAKQFSPRNLKTATSHTHERTEMRSICYNSCTAQFLQRKYDEHKNAAKYPFSLLTPSCSSFCFPFDRS